MNVQDESKTFRFASLFSQSGNKYLTGVKETSDDYLVVLEVFLAEK